MRRASASMPLLDDWVVATSRRSAGSGSRSRAAARSTDDQRLLSQQRDLLAQLEDPVLPVALRVEPGERRGKRRIVPAPRDPRRIVEQAQGAQRLEEAQLAP